MIQKIKRQVNANPSPELNAHELLVLSHQVFQDLDELLFHLAWAVLSPLAWELVVFTRLNSCFHMIQPARCSSTLPPGHCRTAPTVACHSTEAPTNLRPQSS